MGKTSAWALLIGRFLMALIFIVAGAGKIGSYGGTQEYMQAMGVPGAVLPLVILTELGGGLAICFGLKTKLVAILLAGFSVVSGVIFHHNFADQVQAIMFMKNLAMAGGFLVLAASGAGAISLDEKLRKQ
ncbi:MAG: DoxX family protein [Rhodocyclaceae bacterium]|nr:DoxX family protein [Rhodocyclaceae bacterium]